MKFVVLLLVTFLFHDAKGNEVLSCLHCSSFLSMDDCTENQREQICFGEENRCGTFISHSPGLQGYAKGCLTDFLCQEYQAQGYCEQNLGVECEVKCCQSNLCNY